MPHLWSKTQTDWKGFEPVRYSLSLEKLESLRLVERRDGQEIPTTVAEIYTQVRDRTIREIGVPILDLILRTDSGDVVIKGSSFGMNVLAEMLKLKEQGVNPWGALWFWYDSDDCLEDPQTNYAFFVVSDDRIVRERVCFSDYIGSEFDPSVFTTYARDDPTWGDELSWDEALDAYWYREFYKNTRTGQLMVLRPDKPTLFYYQRSQDRDFSGELLLATAIRTHHLLWVAVALLAAIAFAPIRGLMAIVAGILALDFLWVLWRTRNLGTPD